MKFFGRTLRGFLLAERANLPYGTSIVIYQNTKLLLEL